MVVFKLFFYGILLIIAQIPVIDLLLPKKQRQRIHYELNKYER